MVVSRFGAHLEAKRRNAPRASRTNDVITKKQLREITLVASPNKKSFNANGRQISNVSEATRAKDVVTRECLQNYLKSNNFYELLRDIHQNISIDIIKRKHYDIQYET